MSRPAETSADPTHDAPDGPLARIALYELADVEAALGARRNGRASTCAFCGDPEDHGRTGSDTEQASYLRGIVEDGEDARWRDLVAPDAGQVSALASLDRRAPHMREATDLVRRHLRAAIAMRTATALPPLMLLGEPGTGKSWYLDQLARLLGLPVRLHPMSVATVGDGLLGSYPVWRNARPGLIARTLLGEAAINPIVVVDEVDKAASFGGSDPYRPLYTALEPACSRRLVDEYLSFPIDASRVTWILAGNALDPLPAPILDRLAVLEVPAMDEAHLRAVAASVFSEANGERHDHFEPLAGDVAGRLATTTPRRMRRAVVDAMVRAAADGRRALALRDVVVEPRPSRRRAGFGSWS